MSQKIEIKKSIIDNSVNFIISGEKGVFEARYVQRSKDYFICYLSSHSGCNKACRFCHLTATKQFSMNESDPDDLAYQAKIVLDYAKSHIKEPISKIHFNFMARGEPLANSYMLNNWLEIEDKLTKSALIFDCDVYFNISSILPKEILNVNLSKVFENSKNVSIYYSLYSLNEQFRKKWLPKALKPSIGLKKLEEAQKTIKDIILHWAFIKDENDDEDTINNILSFIKNYKINPKFNLVRYNPFSDKQGSEPDEEIILRNFNLISTALKRKDSRIVSRVGFDVKASCGCFID